MSQHYINRSRQKIENETNPPDEKTTCVYTINMPSFNLMTTDA